MKHDVMYRALMKLKDPNTKRDIDELVKKYRPKPISIYHDGKHKVTVYEAR